MKNHDKQTLDDQIRAHAYRLWEEEGRPEGRAENHWDLARKAVEGDAQPAVATSDEGAGAVPAKKAKPAPKSKRRTKA